MRRGSGGGTLMQVMMLLWLASSGYAADNLTQKCSEELQKVTPCLPFASAKAAAPTKGCCDSVTEIKDSDPVCLCFLIQQIHNGTNSAVKSMGIQESRLLQLPSACKLTNASITECPRLLNLPPNSPDAAIFNNITVDTTNTTPSTTPGSGPSNGFWHKPQVLLGPILVATTWLIIFPHNPTPTPTSLQYWSYS